MDLMRAQVTLAHRNGLAKDAVSNNFWFAAATGASEAAAAAVAQRVEDFYKTIVNPRPAALGSYIGNQIADAGHSIRVYDYDMASGDRLSFADAPPIHTQTMTLPTRVSPSSEDMPSEVACCLSYAALTGTVPGGGDFATPIARRRGRVYIGPLTVDVSQDPATLRIPRPTDALVSALLGAGFVLAESGAEEAYPWVVYSRSFAGRPFTERPGRAPLPALPARTGQAYIVDVCSVDDAWDTQRRRGEAATVRTSQAVG